jgi:hypothetical protein
MPLSQSLSRPQTHLTGVATGRICSLALIPAQGLNRIQHPRGLSVGNPTYPGSMLEGGSAVP